MSPRRRLDPETPDAEIVPKTPWQTRLKRGARGIPGLATVASLFIVAAIALSGVMLFDHERDRRAEIVDADVLGYVGQFMTEYTTLDPFNANAYADRILGYATGTFAKEFKDKENETVILVARAEPTKGTVLEAGIEKWHDDGSVSLLVATKIDTTAGTPPKQITSGNRWVVTAIKEGQQWKISQLTPVI